MQSQQLLPEILMGAAKSNNTSAFKRLAPMCTNVDGIAQYIVGRYGRSYNTSEQ